MQNSVISHFLPNYSVSLYLSRKIAVQTMFSEENKIKLSIIVPVYNVQRWLIRCLNSLDDQHLSHSEIILVDDGSTDNSGTMCEEWCKDRADAIVIHKENGGLSDARNVGIDLSHGQFITFIDPDDYLLPDTLAPVLQKLENTVDADFIEYSADLFVGSPNQRSLLLADSVYSDFDSYWLEAEAYSHSYAWNKIYRRQLFDNVRFPKGKIFEDVYTLPEIIRRSRKMITTSVGCYNYCWNREGITSTADGRDMQMLLDAHLPIIKSYLADISSLGSHEKRQFSKYYLHVLNIQITTSRLSGSTAALPYFKPKLYRGITPTMLLKLITLRFFKVNSLCKILRRMK